MKTDIEIKRDVEAELRWVPDVDEADIAVKVNDGVVALTGFARSFSDKYQAETAAKRVAGVTAVANDIDVRLPSSDLVPDPDIAHNAVAALCTVLPLVHDRIKVVVRDGQVTLEGTLAWGYQRAWAETAVRRIRGVTSVSN